MAEPPAGAVLQTTPGAPEKRPDAPPVPPRSTINLKDLAKIPVEVAPAVTTPVPEQNKPPTLAEVQRVWQTYAEQHRHLAAEYQLLSREIALTDTTVYLTLASPWEEELFQGMRTSLTGFLRQQLQNRYISVETRLETTGGSKKIYTNRDKFDYLAEKNPVLREMQKRFGLDADI